MTPEEYAHHVMGQFERTVLDYETLKQVAVIHVTMLRSNTKSFMESFWYDEVIKTIKKLEP